MVKSPEFHPGFKRVGKGYKMEKDHWEVKYNSDPAKTRENQVMGGDFDAMNTKERYKTYIPVNETDT
jgi:hypothetical protein